MKEVTVALVGIGGYGEFYASRLLGASDERQTRFVAAIDPQPQHSQYREALQAAGIPIYADLEAFYRVAMADLVVVAAPIHLHAPFACQALSQGSHVLCEKPLCATLQEARAMAVAEKQAGRFVAVGYQWSFSEPIQALKRDILDGAFGRALHLKTKVLWPRPASYFGRNNWAGRIQMPDGRWVLDSPANNATAHYLHNMFYLLGDQRETSARPATVQAELYRANPIENYDAAAIRSVTDDGTEILFYTAHPVKAEIGPVMHFEFERATVDQVRHVSSIQATFHDGRVKSYGDPDDGVEEKLWQAVDGVRTGAPIACGIDAAISHTLCINAAQASQITPFPEATLRQEESVGDHLIWVDGLQSAFETCYDENILPAENGCIPWAVAGDVIDLRAHSSFREASDGFTTR